MHDLMVFLAGGYTVGFLLHVMFAFLSNEVRTGLLWSVVWPIYTLRMIREEFLPPTASPELWQLARKVTDAVSELFAENHPEYEVAYAVDAIRGGGLGIVAMAHTNSDNPDCRFMEKLEQKDLQRDPAEIAETLYKQFKGALDHFLHFRNGDLDDEGEEWKLDT